MLTESRDFLAKNTLVYIQKRIVGIGMYRYYIYTYTYIIDILYINP